jgi:hypothetical protein
MTSGESRSGRFSRFTFRNSRSVEVSKCRSDVIAMSLRAPTTPGVFVQEQTQTPETPKSRSLEVSKS